MHGRHYAGETARRLITARPARSSSRQGATLSKRMTVSTREARPVAASSGSHVVRQYHQLHCACARSVQGFLEGLNAAQPLLSITRLPCATYARAARRHNAARAVRKRPPGAGEEFGSPSKRICQQSDEAA